MKHFFAFVLFIIPLCGANDIVCELFDDNVQSFERYCENVKRLVPNNCSTQFRVIVPTRIEQFSQVIQLRIEGCDQQDVTDAIENFKSVRDLDISYSNYENLDLLSSALQRLNRFNASHNKISIIHPNLLKNAHELVELDLSHNELSTIYSNDTFTGAYALKKIHLSHNALDSIDFGVFATLNHLEYLDLSSNQFRSIPMLPNYHNLKSIHLENNPFDPNFNCHRIPRVRAISMHFSWQMFITFGGCEDRKFRVVHDEKHEGIVLRSNGQPDEIHCNVHSFKNLIHFISGHNAFENVVDITEYFYSTIETVNLSGNFIGKLNSTTFERFIKLNRLSLNGTGLKDFDLEILKNSQHLLELDISQNNLNHLGSVQLLNDFGRLENLNAAGNQLNNAPEVIQHLGSKIEHLSLAGSFVGKLNSTSFKRLMELKTLNLSKTGLSFPDENPFEPLQSLSTLDISYNNLSNVNFATFSSTIEKLREFYVSNCQIKDVSKVTKEIGPFTEKLDLSGNDIGTMHTKSFGTLSNLIHLNLSSANMRSFDFKLVQNQMNLYTLDLSYNKLQEIDLKPLLMYNCLKRLHLEGNDLTQIVNIEPNCSPFISIGITKNRFSCPYLKYLKHNFRDLRYIGDPLDQKHGHDCRSSARAISDFLVAVYDKVKFW